VSGPLDELRRASVLAYIDEFEAKHPGLVMWAAR